MSLKQFEILAKLGKFYLLLCSMTCQLSLTQSMHKSLNRSFFSNNSGSDIFAGTENEISLRSILTTG